MAFFFIQVYRGQKICNCLFENVSLRGILIVLCLSRRAYAANVVGKNLNIFALRVVSLNYTYTPNCL
jgi:hypothetical protein